MEPFRQVFTISLAEGTLSKHRKEGNITPILKKDQKHLPGNYRPVSLTYVACKMMEKLVRNKVMEHMTRNNLGQQNDRAYQKVIYIPRWTNHKKPYTSLVRPILEYENVVWAPTLKRDQQMLENVQRRTTKLVPELKNEYGERLRALKLPSFYYRRAGGDMVGTFKYLHGTYKVDLMPLGP